MKNIMRPLSKGFLLLSLGFATFSCNKEGDSIVPVNKNTSNRMAGVEIYNGRMFFNDMETFQNYMEEMHTMSWEEIEAADANDGLLSLREHYQQIDGVGEDATVTIDQLFASGDLLHVPDRRFASVLNKDGVFQIGDEIHKITQNMEYIISNGDEAILENSDWNNPNVTQFPIAFNTEISIDTVDGGKKGNSQNSFNDPKSQVARLGDFDGVISKEVYKDVNNNTLPQTWNNRPTRLVASQWKVNYKNYNSHGIQARYEYKTRFAGWESNNCDNLYVAGHSTITLWTSSFPTILTGRLDNQNWGKNYLEKVLYSSATKLIVNFSDSHHRAIYKGATAVSNF